MLDVIIPAYQSYDTIKRTLASLLAQSDKNFKVYVVDDHSEPSLEDIVMSSKGDLNLTYIYKEKNEGSGLARQTGIDASDSEFFVFLDSDDVYAPWTIEMFNIAQKQDADQYCTYMYKQNYGDEGVSIDLMRQPLPQAGGKMYRRKFIEKYNIRFIPEIRYNEDTYYNSICFELGKFWMIPVISTYWLASDTSMTRKNNSSYSLKNTSQYFKAIRMSTEFILKYKDISQIQHFQNTMKIIDSIYQTQYDSFPLEEQNIIEKEYKTLKEIERGMNNGNETQNNAL